MDLLQGARASTPDTDRIRMHVLETGPDDGEPIVFVHGNLSTGRFYEHLMPRFGDRYRVLAPDMRSFGGSDPAPLDATRGLDDWADDLDALLRALGITRPPHLVGWSTAGAAIARYALAHPAASLTFLDPVPPYGYGAVHRDGRPVFDDHAGSGAGGANPEFVRRLAEGDDSDESPFSPRTVMRTMYWSPEFRLPREREDVLVAEILRTVIGDGGYPGDRVESPNWPGFGPGTSGILNALSPKYCRWDDIVDLDPKPPVLWTHGTGDPVVADGSMLEFGTLGQAGLAGRGRVPAAADDRPDPRRARSLRRVRWPGPHRDVRRLRPRPARGRRGPLDRSLPGLPGRPVELRRSGDPADRTVGDPGARPMSGCEPDSGAA